jgi:hypothetical protein
MRCRERFGPRHPDTAALAQPQTQPTTAQAYQARRTWLQYANLLTRTNAQLRHPGNPIRIAFNGNHFR